MLSKELLVPAGDKYARTPGLLLPSSLLDSLISFSVCFLKSGLLFGRVLCASFTCAGRKRENASTDIELVCNPYFKESVLLVEIAL